MKRYSVLVLTFAVTLISSLFSSCAKDDSTPAPVDKSTGIVIQFRSSFPNCQPGRSFCIHRDNVPGNELDKLNLETDQFTSKPAVLADGSVQLSGEIGLEKLSQEALIQLFEERTMTIDETFTLSDSVVKQAYQNAGKSFDGQRVQVVQGVYPVDLSGSGGAPALRIKITITISKGEITIKITW